MRIVLNEDDLYEAVWLLLESRGINTSKAKAEIWFRKQRGRSARVSCEITRLAIKGAAAVTPIRMAEPPELQAEDEPDEDAPDEGEPSE